VAAGEFKPTIGNADLGVMALRGRFIAVLAILLVSVAAVFGLITYRHETDHANLAKAQALAAELAKPAGAASSKGCVTDGLTACWISQGTSKEAAAAAQGQLRALHTSSVLACSVPVHASAALAALETCTVVVRHRAHATLIDAHAKLAVVDGHLTSIGTLVTVSAS
jgi:hypothetical protein